MGLVGCAKRRHAWGGWSESGKTGGTWAVVASEASCSEVSEFIIFGQVRGKVSSMFYVVARNFQFANDGRLLSLENFSNKRKHAFFTGGGAAGWSSARLPTHTFGLCTKTKQAALGSRIRDRVRDWQV